MSPGAKTTTCRVLIPAVCVAAAVVVGTIVLLVAGHLEWRRLEAAATVRVEALEETVSEDSSRLEELARVLEEKTAAHRETVARQNARGQVLIAAVAVLLVLAKSLTALRPTAAPSLERLRVLRDARESAADGSVAPPAPAGGQRKGRASVSGNGAEGPDLSAVDDIVARKGRGSDASIPIVQAIQSHYGYLPLAALTRVCELTEITPAQIASVTTFYSRFRHSPMGRHLVRVCHGTACHVCRAQDITQEIRRHLAMAPDEDTNPSHEFTLEEVACLGCCSLAPVLTIDTGTFGRLTPVSARTTLERFREDSDGD